MKHLPKGVRLFYGLLFTIFGANGFLQFMPVPEMPAAAGAMMGGLAGSGYFFPVLKATELSCGLLLLSNKYVALALTILAPILINIFLFHAFLAPSGLPVPIVLIALELYLVCAYKDSFAGVLNANASARQTS